MHGQKQGHFVLGLYLLNEVMAEFGGPANLFVKSVAVE